MQIVQYNSVKIRIIQSEIFFASAVLMRNEIQISSSTIDSFTKLCNSIPQGVLALATFALFGKDDRHDPIICAPLSWLILHEVSHFELGHFELLGRDEISEAGDAGSIGLISRDENHSSPLPELADIDYKLLERCLELQADHEAIDIFLNECPPDDVDELRQRIAAASAIMILIDVEDIKRNSKQTSHPKAATRIFQMLGHVCELPLVPVQAQAMENGEPIDHNAIPSEEKQQAFVKQVAIPAFYDAIDLAKAADAQYIIDQLGDLPAFFDDVYLAKTNSGEGVAQFKTQGAKEWCQLKPINERVLAVQRERNLI